MSVLQLRRAVKSLPFAAFTPVITTGTGTITTLGVVAARWAQFGKIVFYELSIPITTNGTGATDIIATVPVAESASAVGALILLRENAVTGKLIGGVFSDVNHVAMTFYDGTYPGASGASIGGMIIYETA